MAIQDYLFAVGLGALVLLAMGLPIAIATLVAWWPGTRPQLKWRFVVVCTVASFGVGGIVEFISMPFELFGTYLSPQLEHDGHRTVPAVVRGIWSVISWLPGIGAALTALVLSIYGRRGAWLRFCEFMANNSLKSDVAKPRALG